MSSGNSGPVRRRMSPLPTSRTSRAGNATRNSPLASCHDSTRLAGCTTVCWGRLNHWQGSVGSATSASTISLSKMTQSSNCRDSSAGPSSASPYSAQFQRGSPSQTNPSTSVMRTHLLSSSRRFMCCPTPKSRFPARSPAPPSRSGAGRSPTRPAARSGPRPGAPCRPGASAPSSSSPPPPRLPGPPG